MELRRYLSVLRKRLWLIVAAVVAAVGITSLSVESLSTYTADVTIYVGLDVLLPGQTDANRALSNDIQTGLTQVIRTFAVMIDSFPIAEDAVARTGIARSPAAVVAATTASALPTTSLLHVSVTDPDPVIAQALANGVAEAFTAQIADFEPGQVFAEGDVPRAPARIFERAQLPTSPQTTSVTSSIVIAALVALAASCGLILLAEYLDVTVRTPEEAESKLDLPVLGAVPLLPSDRERMPRNRGEPPEQPFGLVSDG
jgi:capsular polysaccharide biosynthesis protein